MLFRSGSVWVKSSEGVKETAATDRLALFTHFHPHVDEEGISYLSFLAHSLDAHVSSG